MPYTVTSSPESYQVTLRSETTQVVTVSPPVNVETVTVGQQGPPGPPGSTSGTSGSTTAQYERTFTQADLSISGILPVIHNLNTNPSAIAIYNPAGQEISPDDVVISSLNAISVNLESYVPVSGTWTISIGA